MYTHNFQKLPLWTLESLHCCKVTKFDLRILHEKYNIPEGFWSRLDNFQIKYSLPRGFQVTYCHIVWHHCRSSDMRKIERLLGRALRVIYCDRTSTYEALLDKSRLPQLRNRRLQDIAILMYKVRANLVLSYITDIFTCNMSRYTLWHCHCHCPCHCHCHCHCHWQWISNWDKSHTDCVGKGNFAFKYSAKTSGKRKQVAHHLMLKTVVSARVN